eukprot:2965669-Amphidinium_carterae.1
MYNYAARIWAFVFAYARHRESYGVHEAILHSLRQVCKLKTLSNSSPDSSGVLNLLQEEAMLLYS